MKKIVSVFISILIVLSLAGCSGSVKVDSEKQRSLIENAIHIKEASNFIDYTSIESMDSVYIGKYNNEPLEWIPVKSGNNAIMLITKYVIDARQYDTRRGCFWQNSELRSWLNNEFYNNCFDASEKALIVNSYIQNRNSFIATGPGRGFYGNGEDTVDRCFILGEKEWFNITNKMLTMQAFSVNAKAKTNGNGIWSRERTKMEYMEGPRGASLNSHIGEDIITNNNGIRVCIWISKNEDIDADNYIFNDGNIMTNQQIVDGYDFYRVDNEGIIQKNKWVENKYYDTNGKMLKNTTTPDGKYVNYNGNPVIIEEEINTIDKNAIKGDTWVKTNNGLWFYVENDRKTMKKGWFVDPQDNQTYYLDKETGIMATGWKQIDGKMHYFSEEHAKVPNWYYESTTDTWLSYGIDIKSYGSMYKDEITPDGKKVDKDGKLIK